MLANVPEPNNNDNNNNMNNINNNNPNDGTGNGNSPSPMAQVDPAFLRAITILFSQHQTLNSHLQVLTAQRQAIVSQNHAIQQLQGEVHVLRAQFNAAAQPAPQPAISRDAQVSPASPRLHHAYPVQPVHYQDVPGGGPAQTQTPVVIQLGRPGEGGLPYPYPYPYPYPGPYSPVSSAADSGDDGERRMWQQQYGAHDGHHAQVLRRPHRCQHHHRVQHVHHRRHCAGDEELAARRRHGHPYCGCVRCVRDGRVVKEPLRRRD